MSQGFVYVLVNSSMPDLVKVGFTTRDPKGRALELGAATGVPTPFLVVYEKLVGDCEAAEAFVHSELARLGHRVAKNREFFRASVSVVLEVILSLPASVVRLTSTEVDEALIEGATREVPPPWLDLWTSAEEYLRGTETVFRDHRKARSLYRDAAKLGCAKANHRLAEDALSESIVNRRPPPFEALEFARMGVSQGNYPCYLVLADCYYGMQGESGNAKKALALFFESRASNYCADLEHELRVVSTLSRLFMQRAEAILELSPSARSQVHEIKTEILACLMEHERAFLETAHMAEVAKLAEEVRDLIHAL